MAKETKKENLEYKVLKDIGEELHEVHRKVDEIYSQMEDNYHILREILDATTDENGASWRDLFDSEYG